MVHHLMVRYILSIRHFYTRVQIWVAGAQGPSPTTASGEASTASRTTTTTSRGERARALTVATRASRYRKRATFGC